MLVGCFSCRNKIQNQKCVVKCFNIKQIGVLDLIYVCVDSLFVLTTVVALLCFRAATLPRESRFHK